MRRFLYITPYFPPQSRVGALRPLKLSRHLPKYGWTPVVLADLRPDDARDPALLDEIPPSVDVHRTYSPVARRRASSIDFLHDQTSSGRPSSRRQPRWWDPVVQEFLRRPELLPLGRHSIDVVPAIRAGNRVLDEQPGCEAIVVNVDPYAATLVGAHLGRTRGLPVILDFRDPWAPCELRRPLRPLPMRWAVDKMERFAVEASAATILNTDTALADYREHYRDIDPGRFTCVRNHHDRALIDHGTHQGFDRFTLLYLGNFRRFVGAEVWLQVLAELKRGGVESSAVQMVVAGTFPADAQALARELGVEQYIRISPRVSYRETLPLMNAADLLTAISHASHQRIPAKVYDYMASDRSLLVASRNPELKQMIESVGRGRVIPPTEVAALADVVVEQLKGSRPSAPAKDVDLGADAAAKKFATILSNVARSGRHSSVQMGSAPTTGA